MKTVGKIYLSRALFNKLEVPMQQEIKVRAGNIVVNSQLIIKNNSRKIYMLSPSLARILYLQNRRRLQLRYEKEGNTLHIGPIIGIFSSFLPNKEEYNPNSIQAELIYLSNIGKTLPAQVYIFTPDSINWSNKTIRGYVYSHRIPEKGVWVSNIYPFPDVVYDRISNRSSESRRITKNTTEKLKKLHYLKYFNPSFLNKWKVYEMLITEPELHPFLPETRRLTIENMEEMLDKYKTLYLKPGNGSLGRGIIKVRREKSGILRYIVYRRGRTRGRADNVSELMRKTRGHRKNKSYIIQEGIKLANYKGSSFDIRIIYQKNLKGEWQISKKFVRVAPRGSSISNLSSGGRVERSKKVFRYLYRNQDLIQSKNNEIKVLCKKVAHTLERVSNDTFGELGLDIGVDANGKPWLIEVNSKPRKTTETEFSKGIVRNTFKRPLQYGIYLAGFKK